MPHATRTFHTPCTLYCALSHMYCAQSSTFRYLFSHRFSQSRVHCSQNRGYGGGSLTCTHRAPCCQGIQKLCPHDSEKGTEEGNSTSSEPPRPTPTPLGGPSTNSTAEKLKGKDFWAVFWGTSPWISDPPWSGFKGCLLESCLPVALTRTKTCGAALLSYRAGVPLAVVGPSAPHHRMAVMTMK